jgi:hypothetical protein
MAPQAAPEPEPSPEPESIIPQGLSEPTSDAFDTPAFDAPAFDAPFGAPPDAEAFSGETRAFPRMTYDELQQLATPPVTATAAPEPEPPAPEPSSLWDEPAVSPFDAPDEAPLAGGQTQAFPSVSFEDLQQQMATPAPEPAPEPALETLPEPEPLPQPEASPWDEQPAFGGGATQAFPKMSFDELAASAAPEPEPAPWEMQSSPAVEEEPVATGSPDEAPEEETLPPPPALAPDTPAIPIRGSELSDEQVDRIARRVVELMSDQVIRNIAWEVIPDLAEMVVKERIRQLESEA